MLKGRQINVGPTSQTTATMRKHYTQTCSLPISWIQPLERVSEESNLSVSEIAREAFTQWFEKNGTPLPKK